MRTTAIGTVIGAAILLMSMASWLISRPPSLGEKLMASLVDGPVTDCSRGFLWVASHDDCLSCRNLGWMIRRTRQLAGMPTSIVTFHEDTSDVAGFLTRERVENVPIHSWSRIDKLISMGTVSLPALLAYEAPNGVTVVEEGFGAQFSRELPEIIDEYNEWGKDGGCIPDHETTLTERGVR